MSGSILTVNMRAEMFLARMGGARDRLMSNLRKAVQRLAIKGQGKVKEDKLTGQVLHVRSGTLRRSINQQILETATSIFGKVGTNLAYAAIHEYGFDGIEHVREHTRRSVRQLALKRTQQPRKSQGEIVVRAHDRHMVMPKRSFLISTLMDMASEIQTSLRSAISQSVAAQ